MDIGKIEIDNAGASGSTPQFPSAWNPTNTSNWSGGQKTAQQILQDLANMAFGPWAASGYAVRPNRVREELEQINARLSEEKEKFVK
jgi:hypothetical protein